MDIHYNFWCYSPNFFI